MKRHRQREREREESRYEKRSRVARRARGKGSTGSSGLGHTMRPYYVSTRFSSVSPQPVPRRLRFRALKGPRAPSLSHSSTLEILSRAGESRESGDDDFPRRAMKFYRFHGILCSPKERERERERERALDSISVLLIEASADR